MQVFLRPLPVVYFELLSEPLPEEEPRELPPELLLEELPDELRPPDVLLVELPEEERPPSDSSFLFLLWYACSCGCWLTRLRSAPPLLFGSSAIV